MDRIVFWKEKDKQIVDPDLFSINAEAFAKKMAYDHDDSRGKLNKRTQIRKFFDEVVYLDMTAKSRPDDWPSISPLVHMMTAKAAYARGRDLVSDAFLQFIRQSVEQVDDPEDLSVFATFFEAFIGFYRLHGPSN
ncbi:MAG: type III-A CRISPR-associated protein Csm2 [Deltaproteobacteria bacterium]|nr:MAG: type III-A CRISPR-associated protein Csm2 [Deltaproteobacteria bacterium]